MRSMLSSRLSRRRLVATAATVVAGALTGCRRRRDVVVAREGSVWYRDQGPVWSPESGAIAALRQWSNGDVEVVLVDPGTGGVRSLASPEPGPPGGLRSDGGNWAGLDNLAWRPDGTEICVPRAEWASEDGEARFVGVGLYSVRVAGAAVRPLAAHSPTYTFPYRWYRSPAWSADGLNLAFIGEDGVGRTLLRVIETRASSDVTEGALYDRYLSRDWPAWSPVGRRLCFRQGVLADPSADPIETVRVVERGSGRSERILRLAPDEGEVWVGKGMPAQKPTVTSLGWSPDGSRIACAVLPYPPDVRASAIWVLDPTVPDEPIVLRAQPGAAYVAPTWLEPGLLGVTEVMAGDIRAVRLRLDGTQQVVAGGLPSRDVAWSPDGRRIAVAGPVAPNRKRAALSTLRVLEIGKA